MSPFRRPPPQPQPPPEHFLPPLQPQPQALPPVGAVCTPATVEPSWQEGINVRPEQPTSVSLRPQWFTLSSQFTYPAAPTIENYRNTPFYLRNVDVFNPF